MDKTFGKVEGDVKYRASSFKDINPKVNNIKHVVTYYESLYLYKLIIVTNFCLLILLVIVTMKLIT